MLNSSNKNFFFAEIEPRFRKDVDAATGADRYSKYI